MASKVFLGFKKFGEESLAKRNRCFISRVEFTSAVFCYSVAGNFNESKCISLGLAGYKIFR
jgi:hypothetical protein